MFMEIEEPFSYLDAAPGADEGEGPDSGEAGEER